MPKTIPEVSELAALIQPDVLAARGFPKPQRVLMVERRDNTDLDSYYIYLVYPDPVPDNELRLSKTGEMQQRVFQTIYEHADHERYPYVHLCRPSGLPRGF